MSYSIFRRTAVGAVAIVGALSMAACNSDTASVTTNTATPPATSSSSTPPPTSSAPETSTSEATTPSETSSDAGKPVTGPTALSNPDGTFKIGQPAVIKDSDDIYRLTPKSLEVAPDSAYNEARLKKANGTLYYLKFEITGITVASKYFSTSTVNGLFFHPKIDKSVKDAKRLYGDTAACTSDSKKLAVGETGSACYMYQIPGPTVTDVIYNDYEHNITWTK